MQERAVKLGQEGARMGVGGEGKDKCGYAAVANMLGGMGKCAYNIMLYIVRTQ